MTHKLEDNPVTSTKTANNFKKMAKMSLRLISGYYCFSVA